MAKKGSRNFPRRTGEKPPVWRIIITVLGDGNGFKGFRHTIPFRAFNEGEAQEKALSKMQRLLDVSLCNIHSSPKMEVLLKKNPISGRSNGGVNSYVLREHSAYYQAVMRARRPSQIFKVVNA